MNLQQACEQAVGLLQQGRPADAEQLFRAVLAAEPDNFTARYMLGLIRFQQGKIAQALELIDGALQTRPDATEALTNYGLVLQAAGRLEDALASYDRSLAIQPRDDYALYHRGNALSDMKRFTEALASHDKALAIRPDFVEALYGRGTALSDLGRFEDAVASYDKALAIRPDFVMALNDRGAALLELDRFAEALASYDRALAIAPNFVTVLNNRSNALMQMKRFEEALAGFDKALAAGPVLAETLNNRGNALRELKRFAEALASYDKALAIKPGIAETLSNRGNALRDLGRLDEALASYQAALKIEPRHPKALYNLGWALCETHRIDEGFAVFARRAQMIHGAGANPRPRRTAIPPHKARHDREQRAYLGGQTDEHDALPFRIAGGERLAGPAVNPANAGGDIAQRWKTAIPQIVVIDNLLTDEALKALRRFCWDSTVWGEDHEGGYLGAMPANGFAAPLLAQIAEELRSVFPPIFGAHPLLFLWGFKYDSGLNGIKVHADFAAVNVNFWITPDDANLDPASGGLVVWDVAAPPDWEFNKYNNDTAAIRDFLARQNAKSVTIPHRANRAVIFDSDLFHETDRMMFKDGYQNRRINITLLYGRRESH